MADFEYPERDYGGEAVRDALRAAKAIGAAREHEEPAGPLPFAPPEAYDEGRAPDARHGDGPVSLDDFWAYMPTHQYLFTPTGESWPATSVNSRIPPIALKDKSGNALLDDEGKPKMLAANKWLDEHRAVEQMTWVPGAPKIVDGKLVDDGGWIRRPGCRVFNLYTPPEQLAGDARQATPWLNHVRRIYPDEADHIIRWLAHRVQRPHEKINHALVLGGNQGIGKDTLLEPVKAAIGPRNFAEVSPKQITSTWNGFAKSVILRVSEARDLGDVDRFGFYDHMKTLTAAPPDVLRVEEKFKNAYAIFNVVGVVITSNHKSDGIFLPADDRRHFVAWSDLSREEFDEGYWRRIYGWFQQGGIGHVAAYLRALDLSEFDAKAPPPKTQAFWDIVSASQAPEDADMADALDRLKNPAAITITDIVRVSPDSFASWLCDRKNSRRIPHRMEQCGYAAVRNQAANDGLFKINGKRCVIYASSSLSIRDRITAAEKLMK